MIALRLDDNEHLAESVDVGTSGYLLKESPAEQLLAAIREVHRGSNFLSPRLLTRLVDDFRVQGRGTPRQPRFGSMTQREREILKMLAEGQSVKEITGGSSVSFGLGFGFSQAWPTFSESQPSSVLG